MPSQPSAVLPGRGHGLILFFSKDTPPTPIYTLSLHDALPIFLPLNTTNSDGHELVLSVNSYDHVEVDKEELDFLVTMSHLAAIAVNKAKLVQTERAHSARLQGVLDLSGTLFNRVLSGDTTETLAAIIGNVVVRQLNF